MTRARQLDVPLTNGRVFNVFRRSWIAVAQGIPVAWGVAIAAIATEAAGVYCLTAHDSHHAHLYLIVFKTISTFTALLAVLRTTLPVRADLKKHRAMTKLWAFKALIFLQVAQDVSSSLSPPIFLNIHGLPHVDDRYTFRNRKQSLRDP